MIQYPIPPGAPGVLGGMFLGSSHTEPQAVHIAHHEGQD